MSAFRIKFIPERYPLNKFECNVDIPIQRKSMNGKGLSTTWRALRSEDMNADVGGALIADKVAYVFHIAPEQQSFAKVKELIEEKANEFMLLKDKVWGFICGGWAFDNNNDVAKKSFDVYNTIADKMEDMKIPFGMVCGKEPGNHFDNFRLRENSVYVWSDLIKNRFADKVNPPQEEIINNLEKDYQFVEFNPEIELYCPKKIRGAEETGIYTDILV